MQGPQKAPACFEHAPTRSFTRTPPIPPACGARSKGRRPRKQRLWWRHMTDQGTERGSRIRSNPRRGTGTTGFALIRVIRHDYGHGAA